MTCLVLTAKNYSNISDHKNALIELLKNLDVIESRYSHDYYLVGKHYLNYISFIGCSPTINLKPASDSSPSDLNKSTSDLNCIQFDFNNNTLIFNSCDYGVKAICPECKEIIPNWEQLITTWKKTLNLQNRCSKCQNEISLLNINWKKTAGFYHSAILFHGIQTELAYPSDKLLLSLHKVTQLEWHYFFY